MVSEDSIIKQHIDKSISVSKISRNITLDENHPHSIIFSFHYLSQII